MFLPKVLIANKKFCIQREKIWSEKNLHAVKSWSCWNSDGDNFLVFAIVTDFFPQQSIIITFRSINSDGSPPTFQMSWGLLLTETWPDPMIRCNFIWLPPMIKSFHVKINSLSHTESGHLSTKQHLVASLSVLASHWPKISISRFWLAETSLIVSLSSPLQCCQNKSS